MLDTNTAIAFILCYGAFFIMQMLLIFLVIFLVFSILGLLYCTYQLIRNAMVYKIRVKWIYSNDKRYYKYSYDYMFEPHKRNWYGLKLPFDSSF